MRSPDSVRRHVDALLLSLVVLVAFVAAAGAFGVVSLTRDVDVLVDDLRPAAYANIALRTDMERAQADARGWGMTGESEFLAEHERAVRRARAHATDLVALTAGDERLHGAALRQAAAVRSWTSFVHAWLGRQPGHPPSAYRMSGDDLFAGFVETNDAVSDELNQRVDARGEEARRRGDTLVWLVGLVSVLGLGLTVVAARRIVRRVNGPLRQVERAVERLAGGDLGARVSTEGPREIRGVAVALNTLAEENQRAREMEERVVAQLRRLDRAKDEFMSTVSHELRTPLTSISGYIELFEDGFDDELSPQQRAMLDVVRRNVGRLRVLIENLLTLSSVEADAFPTTFDLVHLDQVVSDAVRDIDRTAARAGVQVRASVPARALPVRGDAAQLARATLDLLGNAVKFSARGGEVVVDLAECDGQAVIRVVDHGIGIPAEELSSLGTRFFRASNAVEAEIAGTGLGLRIVQTIADNHGGRLEVDSEEGRGTTARLAVPLAEQHERGNIRPLLEITEA
jgi:two-component system OmpR family sensor kinase